MRLRTFLPILVIIAAVVVAGLYFGNLFPFSKGSGSPAAPAPTFSVTDIYGHNFTLSSYRNQSVVVVEFTSISCSECQFVEQSLKSIYTSYNQTGRSPVQIISIFIEPQFGDTIPALKAYHAKNNVTWMMAQDTSSLAISRAYGVSDIPTVVVINKQGYAVYDVSGAQSTQALQSTINSALSGSAAAISIVTVSVFALAAVAGVSTFFSPCAFPMFPGYMGLFLRLNTGTNDPAPSSAEEKYKGALRRALSAGSITALGMIIVFLIIGVALVFAANLIGGNIQDLLLVVGIILVALGALLFTDLQYWRVITPLQGLWHRMTGKDTSAPAVAAPVATPSEGKAFYLKLFGYGMGYAAAAAGCVFPVILSAIVAGMALGLLDGIINILIYSLTAALLMIAVTVILGVAGARYVNQLKAYTPVIKKVSAAVLVIVGIYLIYFFYTAWVHPL
jgi:cytochrome c-type biogenesis protein